MVSNKTLIGVTTGEYARRADFYDYYNLIEKPEGAYVSFSHDRSPAHGRNVLIQLAIDKGFTHILLIDDDMAYPPSALIKLLDHDVDIVSGLYLSRAYPHSPLAFDIADDDGSAFPMYLVPDITARLRPIVAAGLGFLLCKTEIFAKLEKPYIRLGELDPEQWCDDIGFFKRVREAGIQSYVDTEVRVGHMGTMIIWPTLDEKGKWNSMYDTSGQGGVNIPQFLPDIKYEFKEQK